MRDRLAAALDDPTLVIGYGLDEGGTFVDETAGRSSSARGIQTLAVPLRLAGIEVGVLVRDERWPIDPSWPMALRPPPSLRWTMPGSRRNAASGHRPRGVPRATHRRRRSGAPADSSRAREWRLRRLASVREALTAAVTLGPDREPLLEHARSVMRQLAQLSEGSARPASWQTVSGRRSTARSSVAVPPLPTARSGASQRSSRRRHSSCVRRACKRRQACTRLSSIPPAREVDGWLFVEVIDDGVGGATPSPGSGLDGLRQRVETTGGRLTIEDRREGGTRILAELPIDRQPVSGSSTDPAGRMP